MSKDSVKQMFGKMEKDAQLQKKYAELIQAHQKEAEKALADKLVELGKTSGFAFSKEELLAARAEFIDNKNSNRELSDSDLENVAGGIAVKYDAIKISIFTLGIGCIVTSVDNEIKMKGGCAIMMSTKQDPNIPQIVC